MNRSRQQTKAAKARKDWQRLQEQIQKEKAEAKRSKETILKKVLSTEEENALRDSA